MWTLFVHRRNSIPSTNTKSIRSLNVQQVGLTWYEFEIGGHGLERIIFLYAVDHRKNPEIGNIGGDFLTMVVRRALQGFQDPFSRSRQCGSDNFVLGDKNSKSIFPSDWNEFGALAAELMHENVRFLMRHTAIKHWYFIRFMHFTLSATSTYH